MRKLLIICFYAALALLACSQPPASALSTPAAIDNLTAGGSGSCPTSSRVEVELDVFSGNPNPAWTLPEAEGAAFLKKLAALPIASAIELSDNLGYRGFIVKVINETEASLVRVQDGTVQLSQNDIIVYYNDQDRGLEKWLLESGKFNIESNVFRLVELSLLNG